VHSDSIEGASLATLVDLARGGNDDAFGEIYRQLRGPVEGLVSCMAGQEALDDLTQEVFLKAFVAIRALRETDRLRSWVFQIARNCCREWCTRRERDAGVVPVGGLLDVLADYAVDHTLSVPLDAVTLRMDLTVALLKLPEEFRLPMLLHYRSELPVPQVADTLGISVATAKWRIHRSLELCRLMILSKRSGYHG
jgi:RNA polymerase sigma-70 factor, ECF subfamily